MDFKFDGLVIGEPVDDGTPAAAYYDNDEDTYGVNGNKYGLLYNEYAVHELVERKSELTPGWHVPTSAEWQELIHEVGCEVIEEYEGTGDYEDAGAKLKSTTGWVTGNGDGDYGFEAFPAGNIVHWSNERFECGGIGEETLIWSSTLDGSGSSLISCNLDESSDVYVSINYHGIASIRLIKD